jgi:hypothetical protein
MPYPPGKACDIYGPRWIVTLGFILACPFMIFLRFPADDSVSDVALMCAVLVLIGTSLSLIGAPLMAEITLFLQEVEELEPGVFGSNGAYAQGVRDSPMRAVVVVVVARIRALDLLLTGLICSMDCSTLHTRLALWWDRCGVSRVLARSDDIEHTHARLKKKEADYPSTLQ